MVTHVGMQVYMYLRQPKVGLKTLIFQEWSVGSLSDCMAGMKALTDSDCTRTHLRGPRI